MATYIAAVGMFVILGLLAKFVIPLALAIVAIFVYYLNALDRE